MPIRFHLDEHISAYVHAGLRRRSIDVTSTAEADLIGAPDLAHLNFAFSSGRVIVTHDGDFLRLHAQGVRHAGIVYCQQQSISTRELLQRVILIHDLLLPDDIAGKVEFV